MRSPSLARITLFCRVLHSCDRRNTNAEEAVAVGRMQDATALATKASDIAFPSSLYSYAAIPIR